MYLIDEPLPESVVYLVNSRTITFAFYVLLFMLFPFAPRLALAALIVVSSCRRHVLDIALVSRHISSSKNI